MKNQSKLRHSGCFVFLLGLALAGGANGQQRVIDCSKDPVLCDPADFKIIDERWNDTELKHCRISDERTGIVIRNVQNFTLTSCMIENISTGSGIYIDPKQPSQNVTLTANTLTNIAKNGIAAPENSVTQLVISGNRLVDIATKGRRGLHHGIYVQTSGSRIINNQITAVHDGNGIAIRSAAEIFENEITETGKSGIGYFNDHPAPYSSTLNISGNMVTNYGLQASGRAGIEILTHSPRYPVVDHVFIEDNHVKGDNPIDCNDHPSCTVR